MERRPRFRRVKVDSFALTDRDAEIIRWVQAHRFLRSDQIIRLLAPGASTQNILRRLQSLYHNQYLDRPPDQFKFDPESGGKRIVYALGNKGAELLREQLGDRIRAGIDWTDKNRTVGEKHLDHTLLVSQIAVSLVESTREGERLRLIPREAILGAASAAQRARRNPAGWGVTIDRGHGPERVGVNPDYLFGIEDRERPEGRNQVFFFVEADRGTMALTRSRPRQNSILDKLRAYHQSWLDWRADPHLVPFGFVGYRVLFVTTSPERAANMADTTKAVSNGKGLAMFLFTDEAAINEKGVLGAEWINGRREAVRLS